MVGQLELSIDLGVTVDARVRSFLRLVDAVAGAAGDVLHGVRRGVPLGHSLAAVAVHTGGHVFGGPVHEGADQRRVALFHVGDAVAVTSFAANLPTVDLERFDPHVDLMGHTCGNFIVTVGTDRPVRRDGRGQHHCCESRQQKAPLQHCIPPS